MQPPAPDLEDDGEGLVRIGRSFRRGPARRSRDGNGSVRLRGFRLRVQKPPLVRRSRDRNAARPHRSRAGRPASGRPGATRCGALAAEKDAVLLAHNYQAPEIQDVADHVGDSLALSRIAAASDASTIVFAGVHFMAETAKILAPEKTVLVPDANAGCSLADTITADQLRAWKAEHPGAVVVSYVNTTAEVKAETDICCTSSNAVEVVESIPADREVLFLPDQFLGAHVQRVTGRTNMRIWMGECHVHAGISPTDLRQSVENTPDAELLDPPRVRLRHERAVDGLRRAAAHRARARPLHRRDARRGQADDGEARAGGHRDRHAAPAAPGQPGHGLPAGQLPRGLPAT